MNYYAPIQEARRDAWTAEELDILIKAVPKGMSASEIAEHLPGKTRNAVVGKCHRLGLRLTGSKSKPWTPRETALLNQFPARLVAEQTGRSMNAVWDRVARLKFGGGAFKREYTKPPNPPKIKPDIPLPAEPPPPAGSKTFMEIARTGECWFPYGDPRNWDDFRYCGHKTQDLLGRPMTYCPAHHYIAHEKEPYHPVKVRWGFKRGAV